MSNSVPDKKTPQPIAWRYRLKDSGMRWKLADSEDECNHLPVYEREPLYAAPSAIGPMPDLQKLSGVLVDVCQLLDGWHADVAWSAWDTEVRQRVGKELAWVQDTANAQRDSLRRKITADPDVPCEAGAFSDGKAA